MAYFPFFVDISKMTCLVAGGGKVALRKVQKLIPFGVKIRLTAPEVCHEISEISDIEIILREFEASDLDGADFVISATGNPEASEEIFRLCMERKIPVNTVDDKAKCTFYFPALACGGDVTAGISTSGESPLFAKYLRERFEDMLDEKTLAAGMLLGRYRPLILEKVKGEENRKKLQEKILRRCIDGEKLPADDEINSVIKEFCIDEN